MAKRPSNNPEGRPAYPPGIARDRVIRFRVTALEAEDLADRARRDGVSVSDYIRSTLELRWR